MPELPEVETIKRALETAMTERTIKNVQIRRYDLRTPIPQDLGQSLTGRKIATLTRRGKYMILRAEKTNPIIWHLGMSGRVHINDKGAHPKEPLKHDHIIMTLDNETRIAFEDPRRFGMFYQSTGEDWQNEKPFREMGAEPLDESWSAKDLHDKLKSKKAPIKSALLDQRVVAGLGNIYVCEALFGAGVSPTRSANTLSAKDCARLVPQIKSVLNDALASGGSSLKDYKHTDGSLGYFQHKFKTYDREGQKCSAKNCNGKIMRIIQSGRSTFYCPVCQK